jgi:integrase
LLVRTDKAGRETWYGKIWVGTRQVKRKLGRKRQPGNQDGLTARQAEHALRELMAELATTPPQQERILLETAAERYLRHIEVVRGRRETTVCDYRSIIRRHLVPFFAGKAVGAIEPDLVEAYAASKRQQGLKPKTIANHLALLHGVFGHAVRKGWSRTNPVAAVDRPSQPGADPDIRFLTHEELKNLLEAVPEDPLGAIDRVLYLTAAMTGLRQGELIALRWRDVDWGAGMIRVRRSYTRGEFTVPKSRRSNRAVPMADRLANELKRHSKVAVARDDDGLVFAHAITGGPYDPSKMRKRFKTALARGGVRSLRFHDLRHTFGTQMAAAGAPLRAIQEWMGHRDYKTTSIYADYAPDPSRGAQFAAAAFPSDDDEVISETE